MVKVKAHKRKAGKDLKKLKLEKEKIIKNQQIELKNIEERIKQSKKEIAKNYKFTSKDTFKVVSFTLVDFISGRWDRFEEEYIFSDEKIKRKGKSLINKIKKAAGKEKLKYTIEDDEGNDNDNRMVYVSIKAPFVVDYKHLKRLSNLYNDYESPYGPEIIHQQTGLIVYINEGDIELESD